MADIDALLAAQAAGAAPASTLTPKGDSIDTLLAAQAKAQPTQTYDPMEGMSTLDKLRAGAGMGMSKIGRAVGQAVGLVNQSDIDEANRLDSPLASTTPGKIGSFVGQSAAVAPAMLIPGANTYLGASAIGAGVGALTTEGGLPERAQGAVFGGIGGAGGKAVGDALGMGFNYLKNARETTQLSNAGRDAAAQSAQQAGYVIPPADTNPSMVNEVLNGLSGKIKTAQMASAKNQSVTNDLARNAVGAAPDAPLSISALNDIRRNAGAAYDAVASTGTITPGAAYSKALDDIAAPYVKAAQGFPGAKPNPIIGEIDSLRSPSFDAGSAVAKIRDLRAQADTAYAGGNKDLGKALKSGADALEGAIDSHLTAIGAPADLLQNFRDTRQTIAKTYTVQKGLNDVTGDVSAQTLAKQLEKGKPLSGDLLTIAQAGQAFPKATQSLKEAPKMFSPLDFGAALMTGAATHNPLAAAAMIARPGVRSLLLSKPYQSLMGSASYDAPITGLLGSVLESKPLLNYAPAGMGLLSTDLANIPRVEVRGTSTN